MCTTLGLHGLLDEAIHALGTAYTGGVERRSKRPITMFWNAQDESP